MAESIIRETKSVCPACLKILKAFVFKKDDGAFLSKDCPEHGRFEILLSKTVEFYKRLDKFYFTIMDGVKKLREYEIWPTFRCNMDCRICCFGETKLGLGMLEPSCEEIEDLIKKYRITFYTLSGGEPSCRLDLDKIIKIFKKYNKTVTMNTNGLKLTDLHYLNELRKSGLDRINLQFDGFRKKTYEILRGADFLETKLKVLENLRTLDIPTVLNVTVAKNINEEVFAELIDYAAKNDFINAVTFFTICSIGGAKNWPLYNYIMPDEAVDIIEQKTNHKLTKRHFFLFQKLHLAIKSLLLQKVCL